tara:strand:- start:388 stop:720 length:333 start_codon:yes stop_codon:yes gene_type:complete
MCCYCDDSDWKMSDTDRRALETVIDIITGLEECLPVSRHWELRRCVEKIEAVEGFHYTVHSFPTVGSFSRNGVMIWPDKKPSPPPPPPPAISWFKAALEQMENGKGQDNG